MVTFRPGRTFLAALLSIGLIAAGCSSSSSPPAASPSSAPPGTRQTLGADPGNASAGDPAAAAYTPTGTLVADNGFRPEKDGLPFQNYGSQLIPSGEPVTNLTPDDVRKIFGDGVCVDLGTGKCDLIPEATVWMDQKNKSVSGGHCFGFSVEAQLLWQQKQHPDTFGAPTVQALNISGNVPLQRQLAVQWASQGFPTAVTLAGPPNAILDKLKSVLIPNPPETYTVGILAANGSGGHAVTPYAIEDGGGGIFNLLVYDNNFVGVTRKIVFDTKANTFSYLGSTNPQEASELYAGGADTGGIFLLPTSPGQQTQPCPFCNKVPASGSGGSAAPAAGFPQGVMLAGLRTQTPNPETMDEVYLDGSDGNHGQLLITDENGKQTGYRDGKFVNNIPGARLQQTTSSKTWLEPPKPDYFVPDGHTYTVTIDGTPLTGADDTTVGVIGPSFDLSASGIQLAPGEKDTLVAAPDATKVTYKAARAETPAIELAVSDTMADYTFDVIGISDAPGSTVTLGLPLESPDLNIDATGSQGTSTFDINMTREDAQGITTFGHKGVTLAGGDTAQLQFGSWTNGQPIPFVTTQNGQSTTEQLTDQTP